MIILFICIIIVFLIKTFFSICIKLEIQNLKISLPNSNNKITNNDSKVLLKVYLLKKIKIAEINLKKIDLKNEKVKNKLQKQFEDNRFNLDVVTFLKNINYIIEKLNLEIFAGTEDAAITAIGVGIGYTIISNLLQDKILDCRNISYEILPIYKNKNVFKLQLDSIITLKMENIINIIKYVKKVRVNQNGRTSNRRAYAYSNE